MMKRSHFRPLNCLQTFVFLIFLSISASAQTKPALSRGPINLDRDLEEPVAADRAVSYYHYALAKWYEEKGELTKSLSEMRIALKYNKESGAVHLEMASLLQKTGNLGDALEYAREAARLDPQDPDPHWFLANIYFGRGGRGSPSPGGLKDAVQELEKLRELTPEDERVYYYLGGAYFELNQPEKAIEAYEKFQDFSPGTDQGYREIAKYYSTKGDSEKAIEYLQKGLESQPDSTESLWLLGNLYSKLGKDKEAIPVFKRLMDATPHKEAVGHALVDSLFKSGNYDETIKVLNDLIKTDPSDKNARLLLGRAQIGQHKIPEAIQTLESLREMSPDDLETQFFLGTAYEQAGRFQDAAKIFLALVDKAKTGSHEAVTNLPVFKQHLAAAYMEMGEYENSIAIYREMIGADSGVSDEDRQTLQQHLAYAYMKVGEYEKAIAIYKEMAKTDARLNPQLLNAYRISRQFGDALPLGKELYDKDPDSVPIGLTYAQTLADAGKIQEGAGILENLIASNPKEVDLYIALSQIYLQGKRYADAESTLRQAEGKKLADEHGETLKYYLAALYERKRDFDRAEQLFKDILKANPQNASALNYIGYMLADRGVRLEEALQYVQKALVIDPNNGAYLDSLGWAFFKLNDMENAEKYLLEAGKFVRNDPVIDEHLGDLYYKTGDLEKAQDFWMRSVNIGTEAEDVQKVRRKLKKLQETLQRQKSGK